MSDTAALIEKYRPMVWRIAYNLAARNQRHDRSWSADDLAQEGFIRLIEMIDKIDPERNPNQYVAKRLNGAMIDAMRRHGGRRKYERGIHFNSIDADCRAGYSMLEDLVDDCPDPVRRAEHADTLDYLCRGFDRRDEMVIRMRVSGATMDEIAGAVGLSESRISQILSHLTPLLAHKLAAA